MPDNLSLFPHNAAINARGQLLFGEHRAVDLVHQYSTPLYLYDVDTIRRQIGAYQLGLARYPGPIRLTYASKAFLCTALARLMRDEGVGLDVASAGEIFIGRAGGVDPADMHLHGNNKTPFDIHQALEVGVGCLVVDNEDELRLLAKIAEERQTEIKIWLRVTPNIPVATHHHYTVTGAADSKFGFTMERVTQVAARILKNEFSSWLTLTGLHMHLGSHYQDMSSVSRAIELLLDVAQSLREVYGWEMKEFCPGGGWAVRYHPADPLMPIEPFVAEITATVEKGCQQRGLWLPTLILEPGRSLVAQAGVALYTVGGRKEIPGVRTYVSVDGGLADNPRPALYRAQYTALLANNANSPAAETVTIGGSYCESGDILIPSVELPVAAPGDILAIPVAGAYQLSMSSNYNAALRPPVIFIERDQITLVQRRETLEDLISRDCHPKNLDG